MMQGRGLKRSAIAFWFAAIVAAATLIFSAAHHAAAAREHEPADTVVLRELLPEDTESLGLQTNPKLEFYGPDNLWDYINGQAALYLDYGFQNLVVAEYRSLDGSRATSIELYQMKSPNHSFGIYAAERSPSDNFVTMGFQGYVGEYYLTFWKGAYYVKLLAFQPAAGTKQTLMRLASAIAEKVEGVYSEPELFHCFPEKDRVTRSERFILTNFLGQSYLQNGYRVDYKTGDSTFQVFLVENGSPEEAQAAYQKYQNFLRGENETISSADKNDYEMTIAEDENKIIIFHYATFMGGVMGCENVSQAELIIEEMVRNLSRRS